VRYAIGDTDVNVNGDSYVNGNCYIDDNSLGDTDKYLHTRRQRNTRAMDDWNDRTAVEISGWRNN